jgi:hypothetical protein
MATFTVSTTADSGAGSLRQAIINANATPGSTIVFSSSVFTGGAASTITLLSDLPAISASVTIDGATATGVTINGNGAFEGLFVSNGTVAVEDLTIEDAKAKGATGTAGGGGGAGLGGGLFVGATAHVALTNVSFSSDSATGGAGGAASTGSAVTVNGASGSAGSSGSEGGFNAKNGGTGGQGGTGGAGGAGSAGGVGGQGGTGGGLGWTIGRWPRTERRVRRRWRRRYWWLRR